MDWFGKMKARMGFGGTPIVEQLRAPDWARQEMTRLRTEMLKLEDEIERLRAMGAWLPIFTAPRDGTAILAHDGEASATVVRWARYTGGRWEIEVVPEGGCNDSFPVENSFAAKYWMPLPDPPGGDNG